MTDMALVPPAEDRAAVVVHGLDQAEAVLREAGGQPIWLMSAPGVPGGAGTRWFLAVCAAARAAVPGSDARALIDCADRPGLALRALREGAEAIVLTGDDDTRRRISEIASQHGATLLEEPGDAVRLDPHDGRRRAVSSGALAPCPSTLGNPR